ncbi:hypothetical protein ACFXPJ_32950, partial [Streptomyces goshikiensis]
QMGPVAHPHHPPPPPPGGGGARPDTVTATGTPIYDALIAQWSREGRELPLGIEPTGRTPVPSPSRQFAAQPPSSGREIPVM